MLEELFQLVENCDFSVEAAWEFPVAYRRWWFARKSKENADRAKARAEASKPKRR